MVRDPGTLRKLVVERRGDLLRVWTERLLERCWRLRGRRQLHEQVRQRCANALDAIAAALCAHETIELGALAWREPVQQLSFTAGWMAGEGLPIGSAVALCLALRDALGVEGDPLFDDLLLVVSEAYAAGVAQKAAATHRSVIEKSQVVCLLQERLPCLFLVGDPDRPALDDAVGRLMMLAVTRDATDVIVDASGLLAPEGTLRDALGMLADHRSQPPPRVLLSSISSALREQVASFERPAGTETFEQLLDALAATRDPR